MAEKRMISKSISISEKINELPDIFDMLLFTWMVPHTDDFGRMTGTPIKVKALVVPMLDKSAREVSESLKRLHDQELIIWYEVDGDKFIQIINFDKHQSGLHKRTTSKIPEFPGTSRNFLEIHGQEKRSELELKRTELNKDTTLLASDFDKVRKAYAEIHGVLDMPYSDSPLLTKLLEDGFKPELIIGIIKEKHKPAVKTLKFYDGAIRESVERAASNKSRTFHQQAARQEPNYVMREFTAEELESLPRG